MLENATGYRRAVVEPSCQWDGQCHRSKLAIGGLPVNYTLSDLKTRLEIRSVSLAYTIVNLAAVTWLWGRVSGSVGK
jgi:hypothetical protein